MIVLNYINDLCCHCIIVNECEFFPYMVHDLLMKTQKSSYFNAISKGRGRGGGVCSLKNKHGHFNILRIIIKQYTFSPKR